MLLWRLKFELRVLIIRARLAFNLSMLSYRFRHWLFAWKIDDEGDLVFSVGKVLHFIKYKEHTIVKFGKQSYVDAPKHIKQGE